MSKNSDIREIDPFLLNRSEAAKFLGIGLTTLALQDIPKTLIGKRVLYRRDILEKWAKEKTKKKELKCD